MKKVTLISISALSALSMLSAQVVTPDNYIGADPNKDTWDGFDVIGNPSDSGSLNDHGELVFEIQGSKVTFDSGALADDASDDQLVIEVFSEYFDGGVGALGTDYGDLFIANTSLVQNSLPGPHGLKTELDTVDNISSWQHAVVVREDGDPDQGKIRKIDDVGDLTTSTDILTSQQLTSGIFRADQEVRSKDQNEVAGVLAGVEFVDDPTSILSASEIASLEQGTDLGGNGTEAFNGIKDEDTNGFFSNGNTGTFQTASITSDDKFLRITLDGATLQKLGLNPLISENDAGFLSFRWTMTCANDVIEWQVANELTPVPEPAAIALIGFLGIGFVLYRRRKTMAAEKLKS